MNEESPDVPPNTCILDVTADNLLEIYKNQEGEVEKLNHKTLSLETQIETLKGVIQSLELQKAEIDADIIKLRLRNIAYQKEHTSLRNSITVVKFQIEKIKESIVKAKTTDLKNLEEFEKAVDEITEKFRSGPIVYDRKVLTEKIKKEKEKKGRLLEKLDEVVSSYETFCKEKGLRVREDESEELLNCILPDSELFYLIDMTKTLDEVICGIKKVTEV